VVAVVLAKEEAEKGEKEELGWVSARVVLGRMIGIDRVSGEITLEVMDEEGELLQEDFDLLGDFEDNVFEDLLDFLDSPVRVVLLDNIVIKIVRNQQPA
jgi:hypothetical protein